MAAKMTVSDPTYINTLNGLPIQTSSGVLGSLTAFKPKQIWQVTGDTTTGNLARNFLTLTTGTPARARLRTGPARHLAMSTGGELHRSARHGAPAHVRQRQQRPGHSDAVPQRPDADALGRGLFASRISGMRPDHHPRHPDHRRLLVEIEHRRRWTGPHTFAYDCASGFGDGFLLTSANNPGLLMTSAIQQTTSFSDADLGVVLQCRLLSSTFDNDMLMKQVDEVVELAASGGNAVYVITAQDDQGRFLGQGSIGVIDPNVDLRHEWGGGSLWGPAAVYTWGSGPTYGQPLVYYGTIAGTGILWGAELQSIPHTYQCRGPIVRVRENADSDHRDRISPVMAIGTTFTRYQRTRLHDLGRRTGAFPLPAIVSASGSS